MAQMPDIATLHSFISADVTSSKERFTGFFFDILPNVLAQSVPHDIQELICIWISIEDAAPFKHTDSQFALVLSENIYFHKRKRLFQLRQDPKDPLKVLDQLSQTLAAVDFFTNLYPKVFAARHKDFRNKNLNRTEKHRLQRALWRFEVCSALFQATESSDNDYIVVSGNDIRTPRLFTFLSKHRAWEIEELASVYDFLEIAVFQYDNLPPYPNTRWEGGYVRNCHATTVTARKRATSPQGITACFRYPLLLQPIYRASTRAHILSRGLKLLRDFQNNPLPSKNAMEQNLYGSTLGDEFIHAALSSMGHNSPRPIRDHMRLENSGRRCACKSVDSLLDDCCESLDKFDVMGAGKPNENWAKLVKSLPRTWIAMEAYPALAKFRSWGFSIWDPLECSNTRYESEWRCLEWDICRCYSCSDLDWD
ncbi:hypothetical protein MMC10_006302 [Thelotrema lepadinum]|nr:hypothetical protein [Thelotrema lepadinum]